jgi:hypothetical protein
VSAYTPQPPMRPGSLRPVDAFKASVDLVKTNYFLYLGVTFVGSLIGALTCTILLGPMMCGIFMCYLAAMRGEHVQFDRLFKGLDYFLPGFLVSLALIGLAVLVNIPSWIVGALSPANTGSADVDLGAQLAFSGLSLTIGIVTGVVQSFVSMIVMFAFPLIVDRGLGAGDALGSSIRASMANLPGVLGLVGINFLVGVVGVLLCCIGGIFLVPIQFGMYAYAYRMMFPDDAQAATGGWPPPGAGPYGQGGPIPPYGAPYR